MRFTWNRTLSGRFPLVTSLFPSLSSHHTQTQTHFFFTLSHFSVQFSHSLLLLSISVSCSLCFISGPSPYQHRYEKMDDELHRLRGEIDSICETCSVLLFCLEFLTMLQLYRISKCLFIAANAALGVTVIGSAAEKARRKFYVTLQKLPKQSHLKVQREMSSII